MSYSVYNISEKFINDTISSLVVKDAMYAAQNSITNEDIFNKYCSDNYNELYLYFEIDNNLNLKVKDYKCNTRSL